jgi:hypothetical protein
MRLVVTLPVLVLASQALAGPITVDDYREFSCFTIGVRGTNQRFYDCSPRKACHGREQQVRGHSKLRVIESCKVTSPLWCYKLAPRNGFGPFTSCQPTLASCREDRANQIKDVGKGDSPDGACKKMTSVPAPPGTLDFSKCKDLLTCGKQ